MDKQQVLLQQGEPVGPEHYVQALAQAIDEAKHQGSRVVLDVWEALQVLEYIRRMESVHQK